MKLQMAKNSLFAILLRSPAWISFAVAALAFAGARFVLPEAYAFFVALPFLVIGCYAGWQQLRAPSAASIEKRLQALRDAPWEDFSNALEDRYRRDGYAVERMRGGQADFVLEKGGRATLVSCKRWKAARTGIEPLRELLEARKKRKADDAVYVAAGEFSDTARSFARDHNIRLVEGGELAQLLSQKG